MKCMYIRRQENEDKLSFKDGFDMGNMEGRIIQFCFRKLKKILPFFRKTKK